MCRSDPDPLQESSQVGYVGCECRYNIRMFSRPPNRNTPNPVVRVPMLVCAVLLAVTFLAMGCNRHFARRQINAIPSHNERNVLTERVGMEEAAAQAHVDIYWNGPSDWDVQRQIDLMESAIHEHSYGIVVNPASLFAINTAIRDALSAQIPVVILLEPAQIAPSPHLYFVLEDTRASATLVAQRLGELVKGPGEVTILGNNPLFPGSMERYQDLEDVLHRDCPNLRLDDRNVTDAGHDLSEIDAEQILRDRPALNAIVALDPQSAEVVVAAIHNRHIRNKVHIIVYDQSDELFILLRRGDIDSIVVQDMREMGKKAVADIIADREGMHVPNMSYLKPVLVTRGNIDEESIQQLLVMNWPHR